MAITGKVKPAYGDNTWFSEDLLCSAFFKIELFHPAWKFLRQKENSAKKIQEVPKTVQIHQAPLLLRINIKDYWESFSDCTACKDGSQRRRAQKTALRLAKWPKGSRSQLSCLVMTLCSLSICLGLGSVLQDPSSCELSLMLRWAFGGNPVFESFLICK